jgi:protein TonB
MASARHERLGRWPVTAAALIHLALLLPFFLGLSGSPIETVVPVEVRLLVQEEAVETPTTVPDRHSGAEAPGPDAFGQATVEAPAPADTQPATPAPAGAAPPAASVRTETPDQAPSQAAGLIPEATAAPLPQRKPVPPEPPREYVAVTPGWLSGPQGERNPPRPPPTGMEASLGGSAGAGGDSYLNSIVRRIETRRRPLAALPALPRYGVAVYVVAIDRSGRVLKVTLQHRSGNSYFDRTGAEMIESAAPLPPPPADIPGNTIQFVLQLPMWSG